ncbi:MAG TPA: cytochrome P450, partial [Yinghuangia sp.]|nr:cytochrome P450 [Yinghuangia sp.]
MPEPAPASSPGLAEIDVYSPDAYEDGVPHAAFARLRREAPVHRHPDPQVPDGFWAVTRHADVVAVSRRPELYSSYERLCLLPETDGESLDTQRLM